jgi:hypothetical protein
MTFETVTNKARRRLNPYSYRSLTKDTLLRARIRFRMQILDEKEADEIE